MSLTIVQLMEKMPTAFLPEKGQGVGAVIHFTFTGVEAGDWSAVIKNGQCAVTKGLQPKDANLSLTVDSGDFIKLFTGELDPMQAFMLGKLKLGGDMNLAMKLVQMFRIR